MFDPAGPLHMDLLKSTANLRAINFGIPGSWDEGVVRAGLEGVAVPAFKPKEGVKIQTPEEAEAEAKAKQGPGRRRR